MIDGSWRGILPTIMLRVVSVALIALVACKQPDAASSPPPPPPKSAVEVVAPGSEPRTQLRYQLRKGATSDVVFALDMDMTAGTRDVKMPTLELAVTIRVEDVLADGTAALRFTYNAVEAKDRDGATVPARVLSEQAAALTGAAVTGKLSPTGAFSEVALVATPKLAGALGDQVKQLTQSVEQVAMPLPAQPVGIGAVWKAKKIINQNGMTLVTTTTVSLTSRDGSKLGFTTKASVEGANQTVMQNGVETNVSGLAGSGDGQGTLDLATLALAEQLATKLDATVRALGETAPMHLAIAMRVAPR